MDDDPGPAVSGRAGRPTMRDVAARAGVAQSLVSLVYRNVPGAGAETRERIFRAAIPVFGQPRLEGVCRPHA